MNFDLLKKYWIYIFCLILLIIIYFLFNSTKNLERENEGLKGNILVNQSLSDLYLSQIKSRDAKILNYVAKIDSLETEVVKYEENIRVIKNNSNNKVKEVSSYNTTQISNYFKNRYSPKNSISIIGNKLAIEDTISRQCITDLVKGDYVRAELKETNKVLNVVKFQSRIKDSTIVILGEQKDKLFMVVKLKDSTIRLQEQIIKNSDKIIKREKNKKTFYKITTIAGALVSGYLLLK
jgi:hypothetical protein